MQLIPAGFSWSCSFFVSANSSASAPRKTSLAGALWTPRSSSLRAQTPATWPLGGTTHFPGDGVEDLDPRPVQRPELGVVTDLVSPPFADLLRVEAGWCIQQRNAIAHQFAVRKHRRLDCLDALQVDLARLIHRHEIRNGEHRHRVHGLEATETGSVRRVAHVVLRCHASRLGDLRPSQ